KSILFSVIDCTGVALAAAAILYGYNGERAKHGRTLSKWFFYLFYPAHLLILGLLKNFIF
ncbi:MAG: TraX family protein, partial [Lachnospiraceae bacterium]|nr:TraX family protein [Lachnospiraceae bacterium]